MSACNCHLISFFLVLFLTLDQGPLTTSTTELCLVPCSINWFPISLNLATKDLLLPRNGTDDVHYVYG